MREIDGNTLSIIWETLVILGFKNQTQLFYMDPDLALEPDLMDLKVFYKFWVIGLGRSYGPKF